MDPLETLLETPIGEVFGDEQRLCNLLDSAGIYTLGQLLEHTGEELLEIDNLGERSLVLIRRRCMQWLGRWHSDEV